jgi:hypothetical protein
LIRACRGYFERNTSSVSNRWRPSSDLYPRSDCSGRTLKQRHLTVNEGASDSEAQSPRGSARGVGLAEWPRLPAPRRDPLKRRHLSVEELVRLLAALPHGFAGIT